MMIGVIGMVAAFQPQHLADLETSLMTIAEAAHSLDISERAVQRLIERGRLSEYPFKRRRFLALDEVESYRYEKQRRRAGYHMAISKQNEFAGINPLLNSLNQTAVASRQTSFQAMHSAWLRKHLNAVLPAHYIAEIEQGMTLRRFIEFGSEEIPDGLQAWKPDVDVRETQSGKRIQVAESEAFSPAIDSEQYEVDEAIEDKYLVIYRLDPKDVAEKGLPVTVIEMYSPANLDSEGMGQTKAKRLSVTHAGIVLVEMDYMHAYPSPIPNLPRYPHDPGAMPYSIAITNPHDPDKLTQDGKLLSDVYSFGIDQKIPALQIPLLDRETVICDFDEVYQNTYQDEFYRYVDYNQPPRRLQTYSKSDQALIEERRQSVLSRLGISPE